MTSFNWDHIFLKNQFQNKMTCQKLAMILENKGFQKVVKECKKQKAFSFAGVLKRKSILERFTIFDPEN